MTQNIHINFSKFDSPLEIADYFHTEEICKAAIAQERWGDTVVCPYCGGNKIYDSRNDCNAIIETSSNTLITGCKNTIIPNSVTSIGGSAFRGCSDLISISIPNSISSIGGSAFSGCSGLTSIFIPNSVTSLDMSVFNSCSNLSSVIIGNGLTSLGENSFRMCQSARWEFTLSKLGV